MLPELSRKFHLIFHFCCGYECDDDEEL